MTKSLPEYFPSPLMHEVAPENIVYMRVNIMKKAELFYWLMPSNVKNSRIISWMNLAFVDTVTGLKIIFQRWPVVLTGQTNFSSVMSRFWPVKILKILNLKNFPIKPKISPHMHKKMLNSKNVLIAKGWFTLWHKHKHKPTYAEAVRCR